ncbi:Rho GTPase-activating protein [Entamoeba marina]
MSSFVNPSNPSNDHFTLTETNENSLFVSCPSLDNVVLKGETQSSTDNSVQSTCNHTTTNDVTRNNEDEKVVNANQKMRKTKHSGDDITIEMDKTNSKKKKTILSFKKLSGSENKSSNTTPNVSNNISSSYVSNDSIIDTSSKVLKEQSSHELITSHGYSVSYCLESPSSRMSILSMPSVHDTQLPFTEDELLIQEAENTTFPYYFKQLLQIRGFDRYNSPCIYCNGFLLDDSFQPTDENVKLLMFLLPQHYKQYMKSFFVVIPPKLPFSLHSTLPKRSSDKFIRVTDLTQLHTTIPYFEHDNPLFGIPLKDAVSHPYTGSSKLPLIVEAALIYFSTRVDALEIEGIFRLSGLKTEVDRLKEMFNKGQLFNFPLETDPHAVTSVLKEYLRHLPEPLLTIDVGEKIISIVKNGDFSLNQIIDVVNEIPEENRRVLFYLVVLSNIITKRADVNKMDSVNMGMVIGSCIFWTPQITMDSIYKAKATHKFFTYLMENASEILYDIK